MTEVAARVCSEARSRASSSTRARPSVVFSPVRNSENDPTPVEDFTDFWQPFMDCTGVTIDFQGTDQFETEINVLLQGGSPPDVIDFPQPGLLRTLATA